jgi:hypothetical protein
MRFTSILTLAITTFATASPAEQAGNAKAVGMNIFQVEANANTAIPRCAVSSTTLFSVSITI